MESCKCSTGIPNLDELLQGLHKGDNVVWYVDSINTYIPFVELFASHANKSRFNIVYFRFGHHEKILKEKFAATVIYLNPNEGFEDFVSQIFRIINQKGDEVYYIFDLLNDLAVDWYSDIMIANFFMLICPYLLQANTVAYFALKRRKNISHALRNINQTAQIVINAYPDPKSDNIFLYPEKVQNRHSATIHMLHIWDRTQKPYGVLRTIRESGIVTEILSETPLPELNFTVRRMDRWFSEFKLAQDALEGTLDTKAHSINLNLLKNKLLRMVLSDDDRIRILAVQFLDLEDLVTIGKRMIGTGKIGGKSSGFLIARAILRKNEPIIYEKLEKHDSFFIGSHLFYTFLINNNCWEDRKLISNPITFLQGIQDIQRKIRHGKFERYILRQFSEMLNYYGQSPIVVRSSSLQEDAFGNSFSGKYETIFCPNQGTPEERLEFFVKAVKKIYASAVSKEALLYRKDKGLLSTDEEMALLVQRVSGTDYGDVFLPHVAGVGFSFNPFVWNEKIDKDAGFVRLVFGLGTRAVDRSGDDYTRLIALNVPDLRTSKNIDEIRKYSQYYIDLLNLKENKHVSIPYHRFFRKPYDVPLELFVTEDYKAESRAKELNLKNAFTSILTLDPIVQNKQFIADIRKILTELQKAYVFPVDIEFTANFHTSDDYSINLLQCRPFQVDRNIVEIELPKNIPKNQIILEFHGPVIGTSRISKIDKIIYVHPKEYAELGVQEKHYIARLIGKLNLSKYSQDQVILLLGPGRWGTSSPNLGVPVSYEEINKVTLIGEIAEMHEHLIPDISLGTHFFNNIVENNLLYFALNAEKGEVYQRQQFFLDQPNLLHTYFPNEKRWENVLKIIDFNSNTEEEQVIFYGDSINQKGILYHGIKK